MVEVLYKLFVYIYLDIWSFLLVKIYMWIGVKNKLIIEILLKFCDYIVLEFKVLNLVS